MNAMDSEIDDKTIDAYLTKIQMKINLCEYNKEGRLPAVRQELIKDKFVFCSRV